MNWLWQITDTVRLADVFDIAFVSLFLYALVTWFRETTSRWVLLGIGVLAVVFFAARAFDMYMTALLFQAAFTVLLVAIVVVFQEDLRRAFERVARWGGVADARREEHPEYAHLSLLTEVASELAAKKVGALIVIKGAEPLDRHIEAGIEIDGQLSKPLLDSIFDPHSMGHDGAVIVEGDRMTHFAAHLPLSKNLREVGLRGTRHTAALGLAELTDAIVLVVSEERGQVSVAEAGKLRAMTSSAQIQQRLEDFAGRHFPKRDEAPWRRFLWRDAGLKAACLALACLGWFLISYDTEIVQQTFIASIEYRGAPKDLVVADASHAEARVTLAGPERAFQLLDPSTVKVSLDLAKIDSGYQQFQLEDLHVKRPSNLTVSRIEPRAIYLTVHRLKPAVVPIRATTTGTLPPGLKILSIKTVPPAIEAAVWVTGDRTADPIPTEPVDLSQITKTTTVKKKMLVPEYVRLPEGASTDVLVTIEVVRETPVK